MSFISELRLEHIKTIDTNTVSDKTFDTVSFIEMASLQDVNNLGLDINIDYEEFLQRLIPFTSKLDSGKDKRLYATKEVIPLLNNEIIGDDNELPFIVLEILTEKATYFKKNPIMEAKIVAFEHSGYNYRPILSGTFSFPRKE